MKISDYLSDRYKISKRLAKKYIHSGKVYTNNNQIKRNSILEPETNKPTLKIQKIGNDRINDKYLLKKTDDVVFLFKPAFIHSARHRLGDSLTMQDMIDKNFPNYHLISRLDFETEGLIAAVNNNMATINTSKKYCAVVNGCFNKRLLLYNKIDASHKKKVKVLKSKGEYCTEIKSIKTNNNYSLVDITLEKATRHQIRSYLAYYGFPILGDKLYGNKSAESKLMLHCYYTKINNEECYTNGINEFFNIFKKL